MALAGMQHLEQSLLDESVREEAEELQRLEQEDIEAIISSMLDEQGVSCTCCRQRTTICLARSIA